MIEVRHPITYYKILYDPDDPKWCKDWLSKILVLLMISDYLHRLRAKNEFHRNSATYNLLVISTIPPPTAAVVVIAVVIPPGTLRDSN